MNMKLNRICILGALLLAASCAKEAKTSSDEQSRQYIEAWVEKNYPQYEKTELGAYILEESASDGAVYDGQTYVFVNYTVSSMTGQISQTTSAKIAQQLGSYSKSSYYGPKVWYTANGNLTAGLDEVLKGIRIGQTRKVLIPGWLQTNKRYDDADGYFYDTDGGTTVIYELTLEDATNDITAYEIATIEKFNREQFGQLDSLSYGFYYKELKAPDNTDKFPDDTTVYINYTGRTLDGKVFDTTIRDTAKKYDLYSASAAYKPIKIVWGEKSEDIKMYTSSSSEGSTPITGFQKILWEMKENGRSVGIFISDLGYGSSGSGKAITAYAPLLFEIELTQKPE